MFRQHPPQEAGDQQPPLPPQPQTGRRSCHPAGTSDRLQAGITAFFSTPQVSAGHLSRAPGTQSTAANSKGRGPQGPPGTTPEARQGINLPRDPRRREWLPLYHPSGHKVSHHLPLGQSHTTYSTQGSTSAFSG